MPSVLLVRHAQGSFGGADYDVLSETGRRQAEVVAAAIAARGLLVERVVSGSLQRQRDTAVPIAEACGGLDVAVDARWNEYDTADVFAHHPTAEAREDRPPGSDAPELTSRDFQALLEVALHAWVASGSYAAFADGARAALAEAAAGLGSGATAVVCTSGGVTGALCSALLGAEPATMIAFNRVAINTGLTKVAVGRSGMTLVAFNEHGHLEGDDPALLTYR